MSQRAVAILDRFPQHLDALEPGKRFGRVVSGLAADLDVVTRQVQTVRTSRRIDELTTRRDLLLVAALHGLSAAALAIVARREAAIAEALELEPPDPAGLSDLTGVPAAALEVLGEALHDVVASRLVHSARLDRERRVVVGAVEAHVAGNGTPRSILTAAAAYLGLEVDVVTHVEGGWWHLATAREVDRLTPPPTPPVAEGDPPPVDPPALGPYVDVLALEENPFVRADIEPAPKLHAQRTRILRGGMEDVDVTIRVIGIATRTVRPMIVHLGTGRGIVFEGDVADGSTLEFRATGRVTLDGSDVTGSSWSFEGAVFADEGRALPGEDFAFTDPDGTVPGPAGVGPAAGQPSRFAVPAPLAGAFDPDPGFPHGAASVGPLRLPRGPSNWTALVRVARSGALEGDAAVPRPSSGFFDGSVFAAGPDDATSPALQLGFDWDEREPFAVRLLVPQRLAAADDEAGTLVRQPLTQLLDRHRCAGVDLRVEYADPRWSLGEGVLRTGEEDALGVVLSGTQLWPDGSPQPEPN